MNVLPLEKESGATFLKDVLTPKDEAFLISFDVNVDLLSDYTNSPREIQRSMDKAEINTGAGSGSVTGNGQARGTLLYDAVYLAAHDKLRPEAGRKILVLLTDGGDQGSQETLKTATEAAQKANAIIYVILIADRGFYSGFGMGYSGDMDMRKMAEDTGGRVIDVGHDGRKLEEAFDQIQDELRTQYLLSNTSTNDKEDATFRTIKLTCGATAKIQARRGYYAIPDGCRTKTKPASRCVLGFHRAGVDGHAGDGINAHRIERVDLGAFFDPAGDDQLAAPSSTAEQRQCRWGSRTSCPRCRRGCRGRRRSSPRAR